jgi:1-acyl-sn-glycerol-3-phosphate acyltransferase
LIRSFSQPLLRWLLLSLANYRITIEGKLPDEPSILAAYPHAEHIDALFLPPRNVVFIAGADVIYYNRVVQLASALMFDSLPLARDESATAALRTELTQQKAVLELRRKHLLIYPQGSRLGSARSEAELLRQLKPGVALMAAYHQVPVIPVGYVYPENFQPRKGGTSAGRRLLYHWRGHRLPRAEITVRIGEAIDPPESHSRQDRALFLSVLARELFRLASFD